MNRPFLSGIILGLPIGLSLGLMLLMLVRHF
jgi:hypothetical protein